MPAPAVLHPISAPAATNVAASLSPDGSWSRVGSSGLAIARAGGPAGAVDVQVLDPAAVAKLGLSGIVLRLTPVGDGAAAGRVAVSVPVALLTGVYGADFAGRAEWLALAGCSATSCASSRMLHTRRATTASDEMPKLPGTQLSSAATPRTGDGAVIATTQLASASILLTPMAAANSSNGSGDSSATSLSPSSQWNASPQTGDFSWSYPLRVPPAAAGPSPDLALGYDSNSINGKTGSTNNQPSQVGEGFDLAGGGFIEHSYVPCSNAGIANSGDLCWKTDNATVSLAGHSSTLVVNSSGTWKLADDDNTKVEHLTGNTTLCSNGTYDNNCWRLTTSDGTQYYFGRNHLPGWTTSTQNTNSAWTVPVCGTAATACSGTATTATPFHVQAWRWNLDYVVDVHGNSEAFYYTTESNKYAEKSSTTTSVSYVRGGYLKRIDYGMHAGYEITKQAPDQVVFAPANRCETGVSGEPSGACSTIPPTTTNAQYWPDVPWNDFYCNTTACSGKNSPTFWSSQRLATITTQYLSGSSYVAVDFWSLAHSWPDPGDTTTASLTLSSITHSGKVGGTITLPATKFSYALKPNRVAPPTGVVPLNKSRLNGITTEEGAQITVNYLDTDCSGSSPATPQSNTKRCFPQYWAPPGGSLFLDWFRIYPVASVIADPKTGGAVDLPDETFYDYTIGTPAYRLDTSPLTKDGQRTWSGFAGYNKVRVKHGDPNTPTTLQTIDYTYLRGMDNDLADASGTRRAVTVTASDGTAVTDSLWCAGHTLEAIVYRGLGGLVVSDSVATPWASSATSTGVSQTEKIGTGGTTFTYTPTARHTGLKSNVSYSPLSTGGTRTTQTDNTFDSYGRVIKAEDLGDTSTSADEQCTVTSYGDNTGKTMLEYPAEVNSYAGTCAALPTDPSTATISDVRTSYDNLAWGAAPTLGDATTVQKATSFSGTTATWLTTATNTYDAIGRLAKTVDALVRTTKTDYVPVAPVAGGTFSGNVGPSTQVTTTDPMTFATVDAISPAWGVLTSVRDVNTHVTTTAYDALGRMIGVWGPDRPQANNPIPSVGYSYNVTAGMPLTVATTKLTAAGGTQTAYQIYDGLLRLRQTQDPAESATYNATPGSGGSSVTEALYDFAGQATTMFGPYLIIAAPSATLFVPTAYGNIAGSTGTVYDGAGRATASITYAYGVEQWRTTTAYPGVDRTDVTPPDGGTPTTTYSDARGRTTGLLQYKGNAIGDPADPSTFDKTSYSYYPTGPLKTMTNQATEQWSWTYDTLGRVQQAVDPDTATTKSTYDNDNELQSTTDANGTTLWYSYDNDGRRTAVNQDSSAGPLLGSWEYDQLPGAKGLLDASSSYVGSTAGSPGTSYTRSVTGYDVAGRPLGARVTLPAGTLGAGSASYTYGTTATYNPDGSLGTHAEPAAGGVPAETLHYTYTSLGKLYSLIGAKQYLTSTGYDPATSLITGQGRDNGAARLSDNYTYTPGTLRLSRVQTTTAATSNNLVADIRYGYSDAGSITSIGNTPSGAAADYQCFRYDYLQRLAQAWTPGTSDCSADASSGNLSGPAPYWTSYTYTSNGNRSVVIDHALSAAGTDTADTYLYPSAAAARPHAVSTIHHYTSPAGANAWTWTSADQYGYDADGQTKTAAGQTLGWTPQGQLQSFQQGNGSTQNRIYDADGNLLVQTDPANGTTAYLGDTELHVPAGSTVITGQRIYSANGQAVAVRNGASTLAWLDTDPHGTAQISESFTTGAVTTRTFDPFGNPLGVVSTWPEDRGFLNKPTDPFSGLTTLGARQYAPALGRFLSVDPQLDTSDPQSINGYSYADSNPVNGSDPSGLGCVHADGLSCGQTCGGTCNPDPTPTTGPTAPGTGTGGSGGGGGSSGGESSSGSGGGSGGTGARTALRKVLVPLIQCTYIQTCTPDQQAQYDDIVAALPTIAPSKYKCTGMFALICDLSGYGDLQNCLGGAGDCGNLSLDVVGYVPGLQGVKGARLVEEGVSDTRKAMDAVRAAGRAGEARAGITKNTRRIDSATGKASYRIPDELNDFVIGEVKNVNYQGYTSQIQDDVAYALTTNRTFKLYVRQSTTFAPFLRTMIDIGVIKRIPTLGP